MQALSVARRHALQILPRPTHVDNLLPAERMPLYVHNAGAGRHEAASEPFALYEMRHVTMCLRRMAESSVSSTRLRRLILLRSRPSVP